MEKDNNDVLTLIRSTMPHMSKGQKSIAGFILNNYESVAYMTAAKIGVKADVSESTVVRFATELGFEGFPEFRKKLREDLKVKLTSVERLNTSAFAGRPGNIAKAVFSSDIDKLKSAIENFDGESFDKAVDMIMDADRIFILGVRSSAPLASFLGFYFNLIFDDVKLVHTSSASEMFEQILSAKEGDVVVGISYPRYSKRTIRAMQYSRDSKAGVIAITDKKDNSVAQNSDCAILAPSDVTSFVDSLVAPLSLINALIVEIGMRKRNYIQDRFRKLENIWDEYGVYDKSEIQGEEAREL